MNKGEFSQKLALVILFSILTSKINCKTKQKYIQIKASGIYSQITDSLEDNYITLNKTEKLYLKEAIKELMGGNKKIDYDRETTKFVTEMIKFFTGDTYEQTFF